MWVLYCWATREAQIRSNRGRGKISWLSGIQNDFAQCSFPWDWDDQEGGERSFFHSPLQLPNGYLPKSECNCYMKSCFLNWHLGEGVDKREPAYIIGRNVNWYSHYGKQYGGPLKILKIELLYDPAIPLLGIYLGKTKTLIQKDTCTTVFTAAQFTIARTRKRPKGPSTEEWVKKMQYLYKGILHSRKKNKILAASSTCSNADGPRESIWVKYVRRRKANITSLTCGIWKTGCCTNTISFVEIPFCDIILSVAYSLL